MPKIVNEYNDHYNRIDKLLQDMPGVLKLIHDDLAALSKETVRHREAEFTTENLLRAMGFRPSEEDFEELEEEGEYLAVPKRLRDLSDETLRMYQCFRAGIEGTISCLKRAYRLSRCCFKGFKGPVPEIQCRSVGSAVFCHNLSAMVTLSKEEEKP